MEGVDLFDCSSLIVSLLFLLSLLLLNPPLLLLLLSPQPLLSAFPTIVRVESSGVLNSGFIDLRLLLAGLREILAGS